jgi:hypothetical protein
LPSLNYLKYSTGWGWAKDDEGSRNFIDCSFFYRVYLSNVFQTPGMLNITINIHHGE